MASLTFDDELNALLELVEFKSFVRYGHALYAEHCGVLRPECTVSELVWGWCRNPCFANRLIQLLMSLLPDYPKVLGRSNRDIKESLVAENFDQAMVKVCKKDGRAPVLAYSMESTNSDDHVYEDMNGDTDPHYVRILNATELDGELWHGLLVADEDWARGVNSITVGIYGSGKKGACNNLLWQYTFGSGSVAKRTYVRNDVVVFQPFKHPLPLMDLDIVVVTKIIFKSTATNVDAFQLFGIGSDGFCNWLQQGKFEVKLCKKSSARVDMKNHEITFR